MNSRVFNETGSPDAFKCWMSEKWTLSWICTRENAITDLGGEILVEKHCDWLHGKWIEQLDSIVYNNRNEECKAWKIKVAHHIVSYSNVYCVFFRSMCVPNPKSIAMNLWDPWANWRRICSYSVPIWLLLQSKTLLWTEGRLSGQRGLTLCMGTYANQYLSTFMVQLH